MAFRAKDILKGETLSGAIMLLLLIQDNNVRDEEALCSQGDQYFRAKRTLPDTFSFSEVKRHHERDAL